MQFCLFCDKIQENWMACPSVLVSYYRLPGTLDEEVAAMKECMPFWYRLNPNQGSGSEHVMEGEAFLMRCSFVDAEICQYRALQDAECAGQLCMVLAAHFLRLRAELLQGDMSGVEPTLRALRERVLAQKEYVLLHSVDMCEAWLYALLGQPHSAAEWLDEGRLEDTRLLFPSVPFLHTVYGQLLLAQGRFTRLIAREESERQLCRIYPMLLCEIYLDIQLAGALERIGKHGEALEHLSRALDAAMPDRLFLPFVENQEYIADLLAELKNGPWAAQITLLAEQCARWRMASQRIRHSASGQALSCSLTEKERLIARLAAEGYTKPAVQPDRAPPHRCVRDPLLPAAGRADETAHRQHHRQQRSVAGADVGGGEDADRPDPGGGRRAQRQGRRGGDRPAAGGVHPHGVPLPEQIPRGLRRKARRKGTAAAFAEGLQTGRRGRGARVCPGPACAGSISFPNNEKSRDARGGSPSVSAFFLPTL